MIRLGLAVALTAALPALAQAQTERSTDVAPGTRAETVAPLIEGQVAQGQGALLRGLDKVSGQSTDLALNVGDSVTFGRLEVRLGECRYPADDPESDAFAQLTITDSRSRTALFTGWMIASSPALSALDDARYDVWVVGCNDGTGAARPDLTYVPDTAEPEGGEGMGPDGEFAPVEEEDEGEDSGG
ncbi:DUF2155 domain-containing protein [Paracoccus salipaludis]|uniref:DUF2155 domain-containing protein n=1 Tax=Paracoccus salipaludis TaxID=2032623 RepID=UPI001F0AF1E5|nr:DUF2155 domain-containing protein [Paracoccus salipaludis]